MKTILLSTTIVASMAAAAWAAAEADANGDGMLTMEEINTVYPEIKAEQFSAMDVNSDGVLDSSEVAAAQEAGLLPQG